MANVHPETFECGCGWSFDRASADLLTPRRTSLPAVLLALPPGTAGSVEADVSYLDAVTEEELQKHWGQLRGRVATLNEPTDAEEPRRLHLRLRLRLRTASPSAARGALFFGLVADFSDGTISSSAKG